MHLIIPPEIADIDLPDGFDKTIYDARRDPLPSTAAVAEFYVPSYLGDSATIEVIAEMPKLRYLQLLTAGVDKALPYLRDGLTLMNARGVHDSSTAELTLALVLTSLRNIAGYLRLGPQQWSVRHTEPSLFNKEVAIIGAGSVGSEIGRVFSALGARVEMISRSGSGSSRALRDADDLLHGADIVILVVPLTSETRHLADKTFFAKLKTSALFVNVARGEVVDTDALVSELQIGRLSAALDVTDPEPLPSDHPLWKLHNCIITPHIGGATDAFLPKARRMVSENLERLSRGVEPLNIIHGDY